MSTSIRTIFMGTADFAVPSMLAVQSPGHTIVAVVTQPDRPQGRSRQPAASAVKQAATERGLPVLQPEDVNEPGAVKTLAELAPDVVVVAAYGQKLSRDILALPRFGCLNVHASLLPRYRGAAPVAWAVLNGERETGVTIIRMAPRLDAGGILAQERTPIGPEETAGELEQRLAELGARLLVRVLAELVQGVRSVRSQNRREATYARRLTKDDGLVLWNQSAEKVCAFVRAMTPWPGAFTFLPLRPHAPSLRIQVMKAAAKPGAVSAQTGQVTAATGGTLEVQALDGQVAIVRLKPAGGREMTAAEFLRGHKVEVGMRFTGKPEEHR